jgi:hypothetical protein
MTTYAVERHTLAHALNPATCGHQMGDVGTCVVCGRTREHWTPFARTNYLDTCGRKCFKRLCEMQRSRP